MTKTNERLQLILPQMKGPDVLDVGCVRDAVPWTASRANACLHYQLCKTFGNDHVVGIDIDRPGVQEMRRMGYDVFVQDAIEMDLGKRFDTIVAGELIEHLANPGRFLDRCLQHLKPGGIVVLSTPNPFSMMYCFMYLKNFTRAFNPEHTLWLCPQTLRQLAERSGFRLARTLFVDDLRPEIVTSHWYRTFTFAYRIARVFFPLRFRNTVLAVLEPG